MTELTLLRHGESMWNKKNLFTGWVDIPLSENGILEAQKAGHILKSIPIDVVFCSTLIRSIMTAMISLTTKETTRTPVIIHRPISSQFENWDAIYSEQTRKETLPVYLSHALNERMYGELQGLNKQETIDKFGKEQVHIWRRSFDVPPPFGESLEMTMKRTLPYFHSDILPQLQAGKNILIVAHGNSLRSIIKEIENVSDDDIPSYELQTGIPLRYQFDGSSFHKTSIKN